MTTRPRAWLDTETTGLHADRRAWEVGLILRPPAGADHELVWLVDIADLDLANADPVALEVGRFWQRHPQAHLVPLVGNLAGITVDLPATPPIAPLFREAEVVNAVAALTAGSAYVMGSNPAFDTQTLGARMAAHGVAPDWHYHPIDVPDRAAGWLAGAGRAVPTNEKGDEKSDLIAAACGLDLAAYERHTALGDCRLFRDLWDAIQAPPPPLAARAAVRKVFERANEFFGGDTVEDLDAVLDVALAEYADKAAGSFRREHEALFTGQPTPNVQHVALAHLLTVTSALREVLGYEGTPVGTEIVDAMRAERAAAGSPS